MINIPQTTVCEDAVLVSLLPETRMRDSSKNSLSNGLDTEYLGKSFIWDSSVQNSGPDTLRPRKKEHTRRLQHDNTMVDNYLDLIYHRVASLTSCPRTCWWEDRAWRWWRGRWGTS